MWCMQNTHSTQGGIIHSEGIRFHNRARFNPIAKEFQVFAAVFKEKSISRASEVLSADQGNISKTLKSLEAKAKSKLFHRHRFGVKPTPAAEDLYRVLQEMNGVWQRLSSNKSASDRPMAIRFGAHKVIAQAIMGSALSFVEDQFPNNHIEFEFRASAELIRSIQRRQIEIGVLGNPPKSKDLIVRNLYTEKLLLCSRKDVFESPSLLMNPFLVDLNSFISKANFRRIIDIEDYDVAANIAQDDPRFACILTESLVPKFPKLEKLSDTKSSLQLKLVTYPGSVAAGWLGDLAKSILASIETK